MERSNILLLARNDYPPKKLKKISTQIRKAGMDVFVRNPISHRKVKRAVANFKPEAVLFLIEKNVKETLNISPACVAAKENDRYVHIVGLIDVRSIDELEPFSHLIAVATGVNYLVRNVDDFLKHVNEVLLTSKTTFSIPDLTDPIRAALNYESAADTTPIVKFVEATMPDLRNTTCQECIRVAIDTMMHQLADLNSGLLSQIGGLVHGIAMGVAELSSQSDNIRETNDVAHQTFKEIKQAIEELQVLLERIASKPQPI